MERVEDVEPVEPRHVEVEQEQVRLVGLDRSECRVSGRLNELTS